MAEYAKKEIIRLHMPGHKGKGDSGIEKLDITEINGADVLYSADGIIAESEKNAALLFGSKKTLYSTEGSSLSIRAMLFLASIWGQSENKDRVVLAGRNAHRVFHSAAALLDIGVEWLYGENDSLTECSITPEIIEKALSGSSKKPFAVYVTSPDYLGNILDIRAISKACHNHGVLCIVDNAHGSYLRFLESSLHPLDLGADMCADSAHKTLPVLTGGGYLHISKGAPSILCSQAESAMALFASTSPSYLILRSIDEANKYLSEGYREKLRAFSIRSHKLKAELGALGYTLLGNEPLKLTVDAKAYGYLGTEIAEKLSNNNIICEHADRDTTVLMFTPEINEAELKIILETFRSIEKRASISEKPPALHCPKPIMSIRDATLCQKERVCVEKAVGRILADSAVSCPPAVPIAVCGERISPEAVELFKYYGIEQIWVV